METLFIVKINRKLCLNLNIFQGDIEENVSGCFLLEHSVDRTFPVPNSGVNICIKIERELQLLGTHHRQTWQMPVNV